MSADQPGLFDDDMPPDAIQAAEGRARMRATIERLRVATAPPWGDQMGVILEDGAFQRAMWTVPKDEGQALWKEFDVEMQRLHAILEARLFPAG